MTNCYTLVCGVDMIQEVEKINAWVKEIKKEYTDTINKIYQVGESKEWAEGYKEAVGLYCEPEKGKKKGKKKNKKEKDLGKTEKEKKTS